MAEPVTDSTGKKRQEKSAPENLWVGLPNLASHDGDGVLSAAPKFYLPLVWCECVGSKGVRDEN